MHNNDKHVYKEKIPRKNDRVPGKNDRVKLPVILTRENPDYSPPFLRGQCVIVMEAKLVFLIISNHYFLK